MTTTPALNDDHGCPICAEPLNDGDLCATDIEMGTCHAACLDGSTIVDLETGEPSPGPVATFRYVRDHLASRLRRQALHDGHSSDAHVSFCATAHEAASALEAQSKEIEALRSALGGDVRLALHPGGSAVCLGGRWKGWLFLKHPDGQWVSSQPLEMIDPHEGSPFAALTSAVRARSTREGKTE